MSNKKKIKKRNDHHRQQNVSDLPMISFSLSLLFFYLNFFYFFSSSLVKIDILFVVFFLFLVVCFYPFLRFFIDKFKDYFFSILFDFFCGFFFFLSMTILVLSSLSFARWRGEFFFCLKKIRLMNEFQWTRFSDVKSFWLIWWLG